MDSQEKERIAIEYAKDKAAPWKHLLSYDGIFKQHKIYCHVVLHWLIENGYSITKKTE